MDETFVYLHGYNNCKNFMKFREFDIIDQKLFEKFVQKFSYYYYKSPNTGYSYRKKIDWNMNTFIIDMFNYSLCTSCLEFIGVGIF